MKQRIMSRAEIARAMIAMNNRNDDYPREKIEQAQKDFIFYMLADGDSVKVRHDRDLGGMVVEIVE